MIRCRNTSIAGYAQADTQPDDITATRQNTTT
jgi:hypothetical protein